MTALEKSLQTIQMLLKEQEKNIADMQKCLADIDKKPNLMKGCADDFFDAVKVITDDYKVANGIK